MDRLNKIKPPHPKYRIKEGDTLQTLTELFGVSEEVWKKYHNDLCRLTNIIKEEIPEHLEEIYLLPDLWEKESILNNRNRYRSEKFNEKTPIILHHKKFLFFIPQNINNRYGVILYTGNNKLHYEMDCKYLGRVSDDIFQVLLNRTQVYINNQEPDMKLYELADKMVKSVYPLALNINKNKDIVAIPNHDEIVTRCDQAYKNLRQYYVGEYAEKYMEAFRRQYTNPNHLINRIEQELFFQLFFLPVQGSYSDKLEMNTIYKHVSATNGITEYKLNIQLKPTYTRSGKIQAQIKSEDMIDQDPCFIAEYLLYPEDHSIFSMRGHRIMKDTKGEAKHTRFEIYHLNKEDRIIKRKIINT